MKLAECDILILPGLGNSGPGHWQLRWAERMKNSAVVEQAEWDEPDLDDWVLTIEQAVLLTQRPVVLVAHSLGVPTAIHGIPDFKRPVAGAFLVAPPDVSNPDIRPRHLMTFGPYPRLPLPFPSITIGSRNDPYCPYEVAEDIAAAWGSLFIDAGEAGHLNSESGHGPWPEGSMTFAQFLSRL